MRQYSLPVRLSVFIVFILPIALIINGCNGCGSNSNDREEANEKIVQRYFDELMNRNMLNITPEIIHEDIIYHRAKHKGDRRGIEDFIQYIQLNNLHFPDLKFETEDIFADDDKVVVRFIATGTYQTNGRQVVVEGIRIFEIENNKIEEIWEQMDDIHVMSNIEVLDDYHETFKALMDYSFPTMEELKFEGTMDLSK